tara:strand:- start:640 stop:1704 length:1065 start_codon:yes stop_codon:yes gene_type:complete
MKSNLKFFKKTKTLPVDKFFQNVLFDKKFGYYSSKNPFGKSGDFITAPKISKLFSEIIAIWIVSTWEIYGKPKKINIIELGPGDGSLMRVLLDVFRKFPEFDTAKRIFLYEKSIFFKNKQKLFLKNKDVKWINNFRKVEEGPVIFFGNEFFDAIPIKQFKKKESQFYEKYYVVGKDYKIKEKFINANHKDTKTIKSFKSLKNLSFIELPKMGLQELEKVTEKMSELKGCCLIIDYGYLKPNNQNTLQSVIKHKKNKLLNNLGEADVTSHVNFSLLSDFFLKKSFKVEKIITQKEFLENMGIIERAYLIEKKMKFRDKTNLYLRLKRLLSPKLMGSLFKFFLSHNYKNNNYFGFK